MPRKTPNAKPAPIHLRIIIRNSTKIPLPEDPFDGHCCSTVDRLVIIRPTDIKFVVEGFVCDIGWDNRQVSMVSILCPQKGKVKLDPLLDEVTKLLTSDAEIHLHHAYVGPDLLDRLLVEYADVNLIGCAFGRYWWRKSKRERKCHRLWIGNSTAYPPPNLEIGHAAWPKLTWITIDEGHFDLELHSKGAYAPAPITTHLPACAEGILPMLTAFYNSSLEILSVYDCRDISILSQLPAQHKLQHINIGGSPTNDSIFEWIARHRHLIDLSISWKPGFPVPWHRLAFLKRLRRLEVVGTRFSDLDLISVAKYTRIVNLTAYYTELTPASWPWIFRMPRLKYVWVSAEQLVGDLPDDLPEKTDLVEVVGLNVGQEHMDYLHRLLERYPNVKTHEM